MNNPIYTIKDILPDDVKSAISEYNANTKINSFLARNPDSNEVIKAVMGEDRFQFVTRCNQIERILIPFAVKLHGRPVKIMTSNGDIDGFIEHFATREYNNRTLENTVSFRREFEDATYSAPETIALWIKTNDKRTTHLYTINVLILTD